MALTEWYVTDAGVGTGTTIGSPMSYATFVDHMTTAGAVNAVAGARYNIKGPITSRGATSDTFSNPGTATSPIIIRGYATTPGDGYLGRDSAGALITTNMPVINFTTGLLSIGGGFIIIESIQFASARTGSAISVTALDSVFVRCKITNDNTAAGCIALTLNAVRASAVDCDIALLAASGGSQAVSMGSAGSRLVACRITGKTAPGVLMSNTSQLLSCTVYASTVGVSVIGTGTASVICGCTIVGNSSDGIDVVTGTTVSPLIGNNMITDNGGYGIDLNSAAAAPFLFHNRTRDNALGAYNLGTDWVAATSYGQAALDTGTTGTTATDYVNFAGLDFNLVAGSPATSAGIPPKASVGALQRDQTSAGGSTASSFTFAQ